MSPIEKHQFKITLPSIVSIIACTITIIISIYNFKDQNSNEINDLKLQANDIKSNQQILAIQQKNGFQTINNARQRDSAETVNGLLEIKQELQEMRSVLLKNTNSNYYKGSLSNNE